MILRRLFLLALASTLWIVAPFPLWAEEGRETSVKRYPYDLQDLKVIGAPVWHRIQPKESLLDIARGYGLGYNELELLYPQMDPWVLPQKRIPIPTFWVLPPTKHEQLVINVPELRLYFFDKGSSTVQTYPIGIGVEGWETPLGDFRITSKRANPSWYIPKSLQEEYGMAVMPPGPENPLGEYFMKFSAGDYGVHGTHMPWGVGRLISHGCIRSYPEHIRLLYPQVSVGARLEVLYEPVKFGRKDDQIFVEVHPDVYDKIADFEGYAMDKLRQHPAADRVDLERFRIAVRLRNGVPTNVSKVSFPGELARRSRPVREESPPGRKTAESGDKTGSFEPLEDNPPAPFALQAASMRNRKNAQRLVDNLRAKGYDSHLESVDLSDQGRWYRVMVGGFSSRAEALEFANRFREEERMQVMVVRRGS